MTPTPRMLSQMSEEKIIAVNLETHVYHTDKECSGLKAALSMPRGYLTYDPYLIEKVQEKFDRYRKCKRCR